MVNYKQTESYVKERKEKREKEVGTSQTAS